MPIPFLEISTGKSSSSVLWGQGSPPLAHPSGLQQMGCLWAQHPDSHIQASGCEPHHTSVLHPLRPQHVPERGPWLPQLCSSTASLPSGLHVALTDQRPLVSVRPQSFPPSALHKGPSLPAGQPEWGILRPHRQAEPGDRPLIKVHLPHVLSHCSPCHPQAPRAHWLLAAAPSTPGCTRESADQGCRTTGPLTVWTHEPGAMRGPGRPGQGGLGPPRTQHMGHEARLSAWHPNWAENWSRSTHSLWLKGWRGGCHCRPTGWGPWGGRSPGAHSRPGVADCVSRPPG